MNATKEKARTAPAHRLTFLQKIYIGVKSVADFFLALTALLLLSPLFLVVAIAIKLDSPGPVFFVQKRRRETLQLHQIPQYVHGCQT